MSFPHEFIIFDTEYTANKNSMKRKWKGEHKEIIQIGALKIRKTSTLKIIDRISLFIKPKLYPQLSKYIIKLTGITQKQIDKNGVSLREGLKIFYRFCKDKQGNNLYLFSYGNDYEVIKLNLKIHKTPRNSKFYKWEKYFYDISDFFKDYVDIHKYSSGELAKIFKIKYKFKKHNALQDSLSIYHTLKYILKSGI